MLRPLVTSCVKDYKGHSLVQTSFTEPPNSQSVLVGHNYHWQELTQVSFLSWQKHVFSCDKSMLVVTKLLFWQTYFLLQQKFCVGTSLLLSWQTHVCYDKTRLLSWQKYACRDGTCVATNAYLSLPKYFVMTNIICCDKNDTCGSSYQWYTTWVVTLPGICQAVSVVMSGLVTLPLDFTDRVLSVNVSPASEPLQATASVCWWDMTGVALLPGPLLICIRTCCLISLSSTARIPMPSVSTSRAVSLSSKCHGEYDYYSPSAATDH